MPKAASDWPGKIEEEAACALGAGGARDPGALRARGGALWRSLGLRPGRGALPPPERDGSRPARKDRPGTRPQRLGKGLLAWRTVPHSPLAPIAGAEAEGRYPREKPQRLARPGRGGDPGEGPAPSPGHARTLAGTARPRSDQGRPQGVL